MRGDKEQNICKITGPSFARKGRRGFSALVFASLCAALLGGALPAQATVSLSYSHYIPPYPGIDFGSVNANAIAPANV